MKLLLLSILALASLVLLVDGARGPITGGWSPIEDITDKHVTDLGGFAVKKHDEVAKDKLKFVKVVSGEEQVVAGFNYRLVLVAKDGNGKSGNYQAEIWEKEWAKFRQLTSFKPV